MKSLEAHWLALVFTLSEANPRHTCWLAKVSHIGTHWMTSARRLDRPGAILVAGLARPSARVRRPTHGPGCTPSASFLANKHKRNGAGCGPPAHNSNGIWQLATDATSNMGSHQMLLLQAGQGPEKIADPRHPLNGKLPIAIFRASTGTVHHSTNPLKAYPVPGIL